VLEKELRPLDSGWEKAKREEAKRWIKGKVRKTVGFLI
jgi:hypothetical protein